MGQAPENRTTAPFAVPTTTTVHSETDPAIAAPGPQPLPRPTSPLRQGQFYGLQDLDDLQDAYDAMSIFKLTVSGQRLGKCGPKRQERFRSV